MISEARLFPAMAAICCALLPACADFSRGPTSVPFDGGADVLGDVSAPDGGALSFATAVHPLLIAACKGCHAVGQQAGETQLLFTGDAATDYPTVSRLVDTSAPAASRLLSKMSGNGHGGGTVYAPTTHEYQTILQWIQQGARP
jgi:hypothetical protein